jgi:hypothetical protein
MLGHPSACSMLFNEQHRPIGIDRHPAIQTAPRDGYSFIQMGARLNGKEKNWEIYIPALWPSDKSHFKE